MGGYSGHAWRNAESSCELCDEWYPVVASQDVWKLQKRQALEVMIPAILFCLLCGILLLWVAANERSLRGADWLSWVHGTFGVVIGVFLLVRVLLQSMPILVGEGDELRLRRSSGLGVHRIQGCTMDKTVLVVEYDKDESAIVTVTHDGKQYSSLFPRMKITPDWEESFNGWLAA